MFVYLPLSALLSVSNATSSALTRTAADTVYAGTNPAIVVGNAQPDLIKWVEERRKVEPAPAAGALERLFMASRLEARGILEGLERLGFK